MLDRRISYAKDKAEIIRRLQSGEDSTGPFALIAEVLVFAAALGLRRDTRVALVEPLAEPIRQSVFDRQGYDTMMHLLALHADARPVSIADSDESVDARARAFEEFANGGLTILQRELQGAIQILDSVALIIGAERESMGPTTEGFELSKLIS